MVAGEVGGGLIKQNIKNKEVLHAVRGTWIQGGVGNQAKMSSRIIS